MRISTIALGLLVAVATAPADTWAAYPFTPSEAAAKMNQTAKTLGLDVQFTDDDCPDGAIACTLDGGIVSVAVNAEDRGPNVDSMTMIYTPDGNQLSGLNALIAWGVMIATVAPELSKEERGKVMKLLADEIGPNANVTRSFGSTRYRLQSSPLIGVWLTAESAE